MAKISVFLINYKDCSDTLECLDSLNHSTYKDFEVIIIDNNSSEATISELNNYKKNVGYNIKVVPSKKNLGFAKATNYSLKFICEESKYILVLNNDTIVEQNCLLELFNYMEKASEKTYACTGKAFYYSNKKAIWWAGMHPFGFLRNVASRDDTSKYNKIRNNIKMITGAFMFVRTKLFFKIHYDESFFFGCEDYELSYRVKQMGYMMAYVPNAIIWHKVGKTRNYTPWHLYNSYAIKILKIKKTSKHLAQFKVLIFKFIIFSTLYFRYKRKKGININFKQYIKLTKYTFCTMKNKNEITEEDLITASKIIY